MISKKLLSQTLREALEKADPNQMPYPAIKRARIMYPMGRFQHFLKDCVAAYPQIVGVDFKFDEEAITKELTVCVFKTETARIRLTFDHHTDTVSVFAIGRDIDGVSKDVKLQELVKGIEEYFPKEEPKKAVVKKKVVLKRKALQTV